jgi:hypothetical protein
LLITRHSRLSRRPSAERRPSLSDELLKRVATRRHRATVGNRLVDFADIDVAMGVGTDAMGCGNVALGAATDASPACQKSAFVVK